MLSLLFMVMSFSIRAQASLYQLSRYSMFSINEDEVPVDAKRLTWKIDTHQDHKSPGIEVNSIELIQFNEQLEVVMSCGELEELHIIIVDPVIHFPDALKRIRDIHSLRVLTIYFEEEAFVNTFEGEMILVDEVGEFSFRPFDLSLLQGMNNLQVFATNWNAEVHHPDALLELDQLRFAQVPVASIQPDFFKNDNLEYVTCGLELKLFWNEKVKKMKPWYSGLEVKELFFDNGVALMEMEEEASKRKKPIDWSGAFLQLNTQNDTIFELKGTGKNYEIYFQKGSDNCEFTRAKYFLKRNGDEIYSTVHLTPTCFRVSQVKRVNSETVMNMHYTYEFKIEDLMQKIEIVDDYVNGNRQGNHSFYYNGKLREQRKYVNDCLVFSFPNDLSSVYRPFFELLKETNKRVTLSFDGGVERDGHIISMNWGANGKVRNPNFYSLVIGLNDTILNGKTYALNHSGDTILCVNYQGGVLHGRKYREFIQFGGPKRLTEEESYFRNGSILWKIVDDGTYSMFHDYREEAKCVYRRTRKSDGLILNETFYLQESNEFEMKRFDAQTGELIELTRSPKTNKYYWSPE